MCEKLLANPLIESYEVEPLRRWLSVGIVVFPGSCDEADAARAVRRTPGLEPRYLWHGDADLSGVDAVIVPGGFSYGDYLRAGAIARFAPMMDQVAALRRRGRPGARASATASRCCARRACCPARSYPTPRCASCAARSTCVVEHSDSAVHRECEPGEALSLPVKHSFGRWYAPEDQLDELERNGQLVLRYAPGQNPNGSARDVAGVTNEQGNVLGLMPHPEHAVDELNGSADAVAAVRLAGRHAAARSPPPQRDRRSRRPRPSVSPRQSWVASSTCSGASRTRSSWRCSRCCGPSTAPTSTPRSCCASCPRRARGC